MNIVAKCNKIFINQIQKGIKHIFYGKIDFMTKGWIKICNLLNSIIIEMDPRVEITI